MLRKMMLCLMAMGFVMSTVAKAEDLKAEISELKAKLSAMEAREMAPAAGGDADSLTSLKGKGQIKIGGTVHLDVVVLDREDGDSDGNGDILHGTKDNSDEINSTTFYAETANLNFVVKPSKNTTLVLTLDLTDFWNEAADQDDLLDECYFMWENVVGQPIDVIFGKTALDFGLGKQIGITDSFLSGDQTDRISSAWEEAGIAGQDNIHAAIGTDNFGLAQATDYYQITAQYRYKDLWRAAVVLFQNNAPDGNGRTTRGMHEDRSDDSMFFESFAAKFEIKPLKGLMLQASLVNLHNDTAGDKDLNGKDASSDLTATSLGFTYDWQKKLSIWGEWQHIWDVAYDDDATEDIFGLGAIYSVNESLDLGIMGEWATIDWDNNTVPSYDDEDYVQVAVNATYKLSSGVFLTLEYAHLWYDADLNRAAGSADDADRDVDVLAFRTGFEF